MYSGSLRIAANFSGHVNLDGLEEIHRISTDGCNSVFTNTIINDSCNITGISSPTLINTTSIYVYDQRLLKSISFLLLQNLTEGGGLGLRNLTSLESVNLPRLGGATGLYISDTPAFTNLTLPEKGWTTNGLGDKLSIGDPCIYIRNVGLESLDALFSRNPGDLSTIYIGDVPNVKSVNIRHSSTDHTDIHSNSELEVKINVSGRQHPWTKHLNITGLAKLEVDSLRNVRFFDATENTFKGSDVNFTASYMSITGNDNLTNLYLLQNESGSLEVDGMNLSLSFPAGSSVQPDQDTGFWAWTDTDEYINTTKIGGYISEELLYGPSPPPPFFLSRPQALLRAMLTTDSSAGLTERDSSELPTIDMLYVNPTKPDFRCDTLDDVQEAGNLWYYRCSPENEANDDDDYDDAGNSAMPSATLVEIFLCFIYFS